MLRPRCGRRPPRSAPPGPPAPCGRPRPSGRCREDRKSTRLNSSHGYISYAVFCLKYKKYVVVVRDEHKRGTDIVLVPQPSDNINDPLNCLAWKRSLALTTICTFAFLVSCNMASLG